MPAVVMLARSRSSALARSMLAGQSSDGIFSPLTGAGVSAGMPGGYTTPVQRRESSLTLSYRPRVHPAQLLDRNEKPAASALQDHYRLDLRFVGVCRLEGLPPRALPGPGGRTVRTACEEYPSPRRAMTPSPG